MSYVDKATQVKIKCGPVEANLSPQQAPTSFVHTCSISNEEVNSVSYTKVHFLCFKMAAKNTRWKRQKPSQRL